MACCTSSVFCLPLRAEMWIHSEAGFLWKALYVLAASVSVSGSVPLLRPSSILVPLALCIVPGPRPRYLLGREPLPCARLTVASVLRSRAHLARLAPSGDGSCVVPHTLTYNNFQTLQENPKGDIDYQYMHDLRTN